MNRLLLYVASAAIGLTPFLVFHLPLRNELPQPPDAMYPMIIAGFLGTALLGWAFKHTRFLFTGVVLAACAHALTATSRDLLPVIAAVSIGAPIGVALFDRLPERSVRSRDGLVHAAVAALLIAIVEASRAYGSFAADGLSASLGLIPTTFGWIRLPTSALIAATGTVIALFAWRRPRSAAPLALAASLLAMLSAANHLPVLWSTSHSTGHTALALACSLSGFFYAVLEASWQSAYIDALTGLRGRRALEHDLSALGSAYAIAMVDVDHFKRVNDRYGHETGDQALRYVAAWLASFDGGRAYRYGGEEFTVLARGKSARAVADEIDQWRMQLADAPFHLRGAERPVRKPRGGGGHGAKQTLPLTVSIGVADESHGAAPHEVVAAADKALYNAKKRGRNRVCLPGRPRRKAR